MSKADRLMEMLEVVRAENSVVLTVGQGKPNRIDRIAPDGVYVETEKSRAAGKPPQLVPMWMLETAWTYLSTMGNLTQSYLVSSDGLNVKRSAAVMAMLARFPGVQVASTRPARLVFSTAAS